MLYVITAFEMRGTEYGLLRSPQYRDMTIKRIYPMYMFILEAVQIKVPKSWFHFGIVPLLQLKNRCTPTAKKERGFYKKELITLEKRVGTPKGVCLVNRAN